MTQIEQAQAAKTFAKNWDGRGDEKQEAQRFWIGLLQNVLGLTDATASIEFEKPVQLTHTSYIDAYISQTKVLIEQKGVKIDLHRAYEQSDGAVLTPYQQAKRYVSEMKASEKPRWIVICNFAEFLIYDLEVPNGEPQQVFLKDLEKEYYRLAFLIDRKNANIRREEELSIQAGKLVGKLYDALIKQYINPDAKSLRSLNILCVRFVFCLYAEDAGLFAARTAFEDYVRSFAVENLRAGIMTLFKALDTREDERDKYDTKLAPFPYVDGGLFRDEDIEIPNFTDEIVNVIVNHCAPFNWSAISPTIFGAVFESTLNPETRRKGGMHYTSIANIHKLIDPLFLDELNAEFDEICAVKSAKMRNDRLLAFQKKLGGLRVLDPACGSGNFLTETYLCLRRLENEAIKLRFGGQVLMGEFENPIEVHIGQFYGIEINDFAVTVAKTALWIAESQMVAETEAILSQGIDFLPLTDHANIIEGNALRIDWSTLSDVPQTDYLFAEKLNIYDEADFTDGSLEVRSPEADISATAGLSANGLADASSIYGKRFKELNVIQRTSAHKKPVLSRTNPVIYDYIIGNPPFVGKSFQTSLQKEDMAIVFSGLKQYGNLDYVASWYKKAFDLVANTSTRAAFVSTNSVCQGIAVAPLWEYAREKAVSIDFAYRTFKWYSESYDMAHVHCVIISFSTCSPVKEKRIFTADGKSTVVANINAYLLDAPDIIVKDRKFPLAEVPEMTVGSCPTDGGNLILQEDEKEDLISRNPLAKKYIKKYIGAEEFINGSVRYCLWLKDCPPDELSKMPSVLARVKRVKEFRLASKKEQTRRRADTPALFAEDRYIAATSILIPMLSSENREYVPIGFIDKDTVASNLASVIPNGDLFIFGVITSSVCMGWMRTVGSRMKSDYRFSASLVYNTFPWADFSDGERAKIEKTAQAILDARGKYPNATLAQLYNELTMPADLRKAHRENDKAVMAAYGFDMKMTESECVAELFKLYEKLCRSSSL